MPTKYPKLPSPLYDSIEAEPTTVEKSQATYKSFKDSKGGSTGTLAKMQNHGVASQQVDMSAQGWSEMEGSHNMNPETHRTTRQAKVAKEYKGVDGK